MPVERFAAGQDRFWMVCNRCGGREEFTPEDPQSLALTEEAVERQIVVVCPGCMDVMAALNQMQKASPSAAFENPAGTAFIDADWMQVVKREEEIAALWSKSLPPEVIESVRRYNTLQYQLVRNMTAGLPAPVSIKIGVVTWRAKLRAWWRRTFRKGR